MNGKIKVIIIVILIIAILALTIYNIKNNKNFFETSLIDVSTLAVAIVLSYFFTEKNSDKRKKKEAIEITIEKIQIKLESDIMANIKNEEDIKRVNIMKRSIDNNLCLLKDNCKNLNIEKDIAYIMEQFENYISIIDNHINDFSYLINSNMDLERYLTAMSDRLNKMRIDLY